MTSNFRFIPRSNDVLMRTGICAAVILVAATLFSIPLVMKYHVYKPKEIKATSGDTVLVSDRISSVWCEAETISYDEPFGAYLYSSHPQVNTSSVDTSYSSRRVLLPNKEYEYWGFHLLRGSVVSLYGCAKLPGAAVTLLKGRKSLIGCLKENVDSFVPRIDSSEEQSSESESDGQTSSISSSQGVFSNETHQPHTCNEALEYARFDMNFSCGSSRKYAEFLFSHVIAKTDIYYVLFVGNPYLEIIPTDISVRLELGRTHYDHNSAVAKCDNSTDCTMPVAFASPQKIYVELPESNGTWSEETILVSCSPREWKISEGYRIEEGGKLPLADYAKFIAKHVKNDGRCVFASIHSRADGTCWASHPRDESLQITPSEVDHLNKAFNEPSMLFSSGIPLKGTKFTFLKVEGDAILGRTKDLACIALKTERALIIAIFPGDELMRPVFEHCMIVAQKLTRANL